MGLTAGFQKPVCHSLGFFEGSLRCFGAGQSILNGIIQGFSDPACLIGGKFGRGMGQLVSGHGSIGP